jgi:hypothetical protein
MAGPLSLSAMSGFIGVVGGAGWPVTLERSLELGSK